MISKADATKIVERKLREYEKSSDEYFAIYEEKTRDIKSGWVFFYNSEEYIRTGNPRSRLAGNGPIFITYDGTVVIEIPTYEIWENFLRNKGYF